MTQQTGTKTARVIPLPVRVLGIAGLIPFAVAAFAISSAPEIKPEAAAALLAYGAVILSFLGGIRWGFAVLEGDRAGWTAYGTSAAPALAAWLGVVGGGPGGLLLLAAALTVWFFVERAAPPCLTLPPWYLRIRGGLTAAAALSLIAAAFSW
jgi:hypothetical protein